VCELQCSTLLRLCRNPRCTSKPERLPSRFIVAGCSPRTAEITPSGKGVRARRPACRELRLAGSSKPRTLLLKSHSSVCCAWAGSLECRKAPRLASPRPAVADLRHPGRADRLPKSVPTDGRRAARVLIATSPVTRSPVSESSRFFESSEFNASSTPRSPLARPGYSHESGSIGGSGVRGH